MSFITYKVPKFQNSGKIPDQTAVRRNIHTNKPVITPYEEWLKQRDQKKNDIIKYQQGQAIKPISLFQTNKPAFVDSVLNANSDLEWVKRLYPTLRKSNSIENIIPGQRSTHLMQNNGQGYVFPKIVKDKGTLKYLPTDDQAGEYARQTNTGIQFKTPEQGAWFSENYKMGTGVFGKNPRPSSVYKAGGIINYKTK